MTELNPKLTFPKSERLCSKTILDRLFAEKRSLFAFPFRVVFLELETAEVPCQSVFTVPKRMFKRAVHRNAIRRKMREAFRLNKASFYSFLNENQKHVALMFIYIEKEEIDFKKIEKGMKQAFSKIEKTLKSVD